MTPIPKKRAAVLRAVHQLTVELRRPPLCSEVARRIGIDRTLVWRMMQSAKRDGQAVVGSRFSVFTPGCVRVTPSALAYLGIPALVYLAWPAEWDAPVSEGVAAGGVAWARALHRLGLAASSPLLVPGGDPAIVRPASEALARAADAVVVVADQLLLGRSDVIAAHLAAVPVSFVPSPSAATNAVALWLPPLLVPQPDLAGR